MGKGIPESSMSKGLEAEAPRGVWNRGAIPLGRMAVCAHSVEPGWLVVGQPVSCVQWCVYQLQSGQLEWDQERWRQAPEIPGEP
jgi:hypothetical protein